MLRLTIIIFLLNMIASCSSLTTCIVYQFEKNDSLKLDTCLILKYHSDKLTHKFVKTLPIYGYSGSTDLADKGSCTKYFYGKTGRITKIKYSDDDEFIIKKIKYSKQLKAIITRNFKKREIILNDSGDPQQDAFEVKDTKRKYFSFKEKEIFMFDEKDSLIFVEETRCYSRFKHFSNNPDFIKYFNHKKDTIESYECNLYDSAQRSNSITTYRKNGFTRLTSTKFRCVPMEIDPDLPNAYVEPCYLTNKLILTRYSDYIVVEYYQDPIEKLWYKELLYTDKLNRTIRQTYYNNERQVIVTRIYKYN